MSNYNTIIFDMDGTILDTLGDLTDSINYVLKKHGFPLRTLQEIRNFVGNGVSRLVELSLPGGKKTPDFDALLEEYIIHYRANMHNKTAPFDGILDLLSSLQKKGYKLAVVSNKIDKAVRELNQKYFGKYIRVAIGESAAVKIKPAPDSVFIALRELNAAADKALYIGDSEVDIQTAQNAGLVSVGVTWGFRDRSVLSDARADYIIEKPEELWTILNSKAR